MSSSAKPIPAQKATPPDTSGALSPSNQSISRATSIARLGSPVPSHATGTPAVQQIPTPSQLNSQDPSQADTPLPGIDHTKSSLPAAGESALANALKESFSRGSPPRFDTPPIRPLSPANDASSGQYGSFDHRRESSPVPFQDAEIVRRHLVGPSNNSPSRPSFLDGHASPQIGAQANGKGISTDDDEEFNSLRLQGGDMTRQIYRWTEQQEAEARGDTRYRRSKSFHSVRPEDHNREIGHIMQPGGFRRDYLRRTAVSPSPGPSSRAAHPTSTPRSEPFTSSFLEFLTLYGHFAGEELEEDDEALGPDEYFSSWESETPSEGDEEDRQYTEESALLTPGKRRRRRKERTTGKGTPTGAVLLLLKSFVGTGVLFLPRAFLNGGMLFCIIVLTGVSLLSYYCFVLLVNTRLKVKHSFGDMGYHLYGPWMKNLINFSLVISQIGFTSAYTVFVAQNLQAFILAVSHCKTMIDVKYLILMQMVIFLPLSLYRNINHIQKLALVADAFIVLGLVYLYYYDILTLVHNKGIADVVNFNASTWTLFIGTAIFTFEGIGLIIPIQSGMKQPQKFPAVLAGVMVGITIIFVSAGALSYAAFGSKTQTVVLLNMPQDDKMVNGVQFIYSLAILLSTPLQLYPAIEITSQQLFSRTGKYNPWVKWKKNIFRFFMVAVCAVIAAVGAGDLDKFVALVGSFACIPLVYIYPPMLHQKSVANTLWQKVCNILLVIFGFGLMGYSTVLTISSWIHGDKEEMPGYCDDK